MSLVWGATAYNILIFSSIWTGAWLALRKVPDSKRVRVILSFSAGIFLGVCFLHMIPESIELLGHRAGMFVLLGYMLVYLLERFFMIHPCEEGACHYHHVGRTAFLGLSIHSLVTGLALGSSLLVPGLGWVVFAATVTHKMPESFSLASLLTLGDRTRSNVLRYLVVFSVMVPVGTFIALLGLRSHGEAVIGAAVAISAGTFLQIATGDLMPEMHAPGENRIKVLAGFLLGIGLTILSTFFGH